ncbi:MAG: M56 family metallopeptidase [Planctomycetota bacterium]
MMADTFVYFALQHLWQILLAFTLVYVVSLFSWAKRRPHLMLMLWVLFGVKCLTPPVVQTPVSVMEMFTPSVMKESASVTSVIPQPIEVSSGSLAARDITRGTASSAEQFDALAAINESPRFASSMDSSDLWALIWLTGSTCVFIGFVGNFLLVRRRILVRQRSDDERDRVSRAESMLRELEGQLGFPAGRIRFVVSESSLGPLAFGFFRPTIVIPSEVIDRGIPLRPILTHELCHVWRRDHLLGFLQFAMQIAFWFHPCIWIASRRINSLCEVCCDDDALRIFDLNAKAYAAGLLEVLSLQQLIRPYRFAPGIRPLEVTKQRLRMIVSNRRSRARRSQLVVAFLFLLLVLPWSGIRSDNAIEPQDQRQLASAESPILGKNQEHPKDESSDETGDAKFVQRLDSMNDGEFVDHSSQMDFLLGSWKVFGLDGSVQGTSTFRYEDSGKMIREDWVSPTGDTAQGITFFDPNERVWKMTWVDSNGVFMESSGRWDQDRLILFGQITSNTGDRRKAQTELSRIDESTVVLMMKVEVDGMMTAVSSSRYVRQ